MPSLPEDLVGWAILASIVVALSTTIGGGLYAMFRNSLQRQVDARVEEMMDDAFAEKIAAAVTTAIAPVDAKIDGLRVNQLTMSEEIAKVSVLEAKLENGIKSRLDTVESQQTMILDHLLHGG